MLEALGIKPVLQDERFAGRPLDVTFRGALCPEQEAAARAMLAHETGVLAATTAFGKTVLAAWLTAQRGVNTLILVHLRQLTEQWIERLSLFLGLPTKEIGRIGGGRKKPTGALDVALMQSLVRYRVDAKQQAATRPFRQQVLVRPTAFRALAMEETDQRLEFEKLYGALIADKARNCMICDDVVSAVREGRSPLVLTERTEHLALLAERLSTQALPVITFQGGMGKKALRAALELLSVIPESTQRVLLATGRHTCFAKLPA